MHLVDLVQNRNDRRTHILESLEHYNRDDCESTWLLRDWLEARRDEAQSAFGGRLQRPVPAPADPAERVAEESAEVVRSFQRHPWHALLDIAPNSADVRQGDLLVTSGLGGAFPAGYPVGTVDSVTRIPHESFSAVAAVPAAKLDQVREIMLIFSTVDETDAEAPK